MSQSIPNCAQNPRKSSASTIPSQHTSQPRPNMACKQRVMLPLSLQLIRRFPTLEQASLYLSHRVKSRQCERFAIQQTASNSWAVCRVMKGGV